MKIQYLEYRNKPTLNFQITMRRNQCHFTAMFRSYPVPNVMYKLVLHCKKGQRFPIRSRDATYQNFPGTIKLFPARESLVSDIQPGTGKPLTFFYSVLTLDIHAHVQIHKQNLHNFLPTPRNPTEKGGGMGAQTGHTQLPQNPQSENHKI